MDPPGLRQAALVEDAVWNFVSEVLKDPGRIRTGIEESMDLEREAGGGDPEVGAEFWEEKVEERARLRRAYRDQHLAGVISLEELGSRLGELRETRGIAEAELAALRNALANSRPPRHPRSLLRGDSAGRTRRSLV